MNRVSLHHDENGKLQKAVAVHVYGYWPTKTRGPRPQCQLMGCTKKVHGVDARDGKLHDRFCGRTHCKMAAREEATRSAMKAELEELRARESSVRAEYEAFRKGHSGKVEDLQPLSAEEQELIEVLAEGEREAEPEGPKNNNMDGFPPLMQGGLSGMDAKACAKEYLDGYHQYEFENPEQNERMEQFYAQDTQRVQQKLCVSPPVSPTARPIPMLVPRSEVARAVRGETQKGAE
jgi:hypothetical protein